MVDEEILRCFAAPSAKAGYCLGFGLPKEFFIPTALNLLGSYRFLPIYFHIPVGILFQFCCFCLPLQVIVLKTGTTAFFLPESYFFFILVRLKPGFYCICIPFHFSRFTSTRVCGRLSDSTADRKKFSSSTAMRSPFPAGEGNGRQSYFYKTRNCDL